MRLDCQALGLDGAANFEQLVASSPAGIFILDRDGQILFANPWAVAVGAEVGIGELQGLNFTAFWSDESAQEMVAGVADALRGDIRRVLATKSRRTDRHWDLIFAPLHGASGAVGCVLVTARDVTEMVLARAAAESRETEFKRKAAALRSAGLLARLGGWEIDFKNGAVDWSEEIWTILGGEAADLTMRQAMDIYSDEDKARISGLIEHARVTGESLSFLVQAVRMDGSKIWVSILGEPEFENGVCTAIRGVAQDVTAAKEATDKLTRAEERLELATKIAHLHVYEVDFVRETVTSHGALDSFNHRPLTFELMREDPFAGIDPRDRPRVAAVFGAADIKGAPYEVEYRVDRPDGKEIWAYSTGQLQRGPAGEVLRLVGGLQNITERKLAERALVDARDAAEAANHAKTAFLANMSHEIRTPLNAVLGMAQAMSREDLPEVQRGRLEVIQQAGETLLQLLNDVLDLSRIEAGGIQLEDGQVDLAEILRSAEATFYALAAEKDLSLAFTVAAEARGLRRGDPLRIRQILYNLVSNAVKFTSSGSVTVDVTAGATQMTLAVADTGPGIPAQRMGSLFEKFVQVDSSTTRLHGGSGLGLAISMELAQLMGGTIEVESEVGVGSTFRVRLPLERLSAAPAAPAVQRPDAEFSGGAPQPATLRVLAAEDNPMNQLVLRTLLGQLGIEPTIVANGQEALDIWATAAWDILLLDVHMPVMDGLAAARAIRAREAANGRPRTPILALTANAMSHQAAECLASGMDGVVSKPIEVARLIEAIETALGDATPDDAQLSA